MELLALGLRITQMILVAHLDIWVLLIYILLFIAPEVVNSKPHGFAADFWALGVIIHELMFDKRPYPGVHRKEYKEKLQSTFVQIKEGEQPKGWSKEAADIVNGLLQRKEEMRLGSKGIDNIKEHPWFKEIDWEMLLAQKVTPPFIPVCTEDYFDENYLQSFELSTKLREDINIQNKNVRNPNIQKLFKGFYFDKDKCRESTTAKSAPTSASKSTKSS